MNFATAGTTSGWGWSGSPQSGPKPSGDTLGTGLASRFETMVRAAAAWWFARPSRILSESQLATQGTAAHGIRSTGSCTAPGWWRSQVPVTFSSVSSQSAHAGAPAANSYHLPVFPAEIIEWMQATPNQFIIDGTLGGGGHSELFLNAGATVLGVDRDPEALAHARQRLASFGDRFSTWEGNFSELPDCPTLAAGQLADGLLLDLGVSSRQLDSAARGFSFMRQGPLDMRMGPSCPQTAADIVNTLDEVSLARLIFELGEEPKSRRIAAAIVQQRRQKPFSETLELADCIERAIGRHGRIHPATRSFQAIRMAVNQELESLATALENASCILKPGGRLLIITFHSLEDRMVKQFLKHRSSRWIDDPSWPEARANPDYHFDLLSRKAILPSPQEISINPRSRSAKLRVARLLPSSP